MCCLHEEMQVRFRAPQTGSAHTDYRPPCDQEVSSFDVILQVKVSGSRQSSRPAAVSKFGRAFADAACSRRGSAWAEPVAARALSCRGERGHGPNANNARTDRLIQPAGLHRAGCVAPRASGALLSRIEAARNINICGWVNDPVPDPFACCKSP